MNLSDLAEHGVFGTSAARRAGIDGQQLTRLMAAGCCTRLTHGWYAVGRPSDDRTRQRLTAVALALAYAGRAVPSHHTALLLADLPLHEVDLDVVHLTRLPAPRETGPSGQSRRRPQLALHRAMPGVEAGSLVRADRGPLLVPTAHAVVGTGASTSPLSALVAADAALRRGLVTAEALSLAVAHFEDRHGIGPVRAAIGLADGRHESPGETVTAHVLRHLGYAFTPQVEVWCEGRLYRADFGIDGTRVLIEFDGRVKYGGGDGEVLFAEKQREDAMRRDGWIFVRLVWKDVRSIEVVRHRVDGALAAAARAA